MNLDILSPFLKYPGDIRRIMYTTNIIESLHRQFRKVTKTKSIFPHDQLLENNKFDYENQIKSNSIVSLAKPTIYIEKWSW